MRKLGLVAFLVLLARSASAQGVSARALFSYENYGNSDILTSGFRQTYDLRLTHALTDNTSASIFIRGDDFKGTTGTPDLRARSGYRQIQPGGQLSINTSNFLMLARTESFDTRSQAGSTNYIRNIERTNVNVDWTPTGLPVFRFVTQRNRTSDNGASVHLTEESALGSVGYDWRGFTGMAQQQYSRAIDPGAGYNRNSGFTQGTLGYNFARNDGRVAFGATSNAQFMTLKETGIGATTSLVPSPVVVNRILYSVDDTPLDSRDHPGAPAPALNDGDINTSARISLGPDAQSFQNFTLDIGRIDRVDEIRVVVRDSAGSLLRTGGGPITWNTYTSVDGEIWTPINSQTTFNNALSYYATTFAQTSGRWFKIVNFGVNTEATLVTEVQAYYHTAVEAGQQRKSNQTTWSSNANLMLHPFKKFTFTYAGLYTSSRQGVAAQGNVTTSDIEQLAGAQYDLLATVSLRGQYLRRDLKNFTGPADWANIYTGYADWTPTKQLRVTLESSYSNQTLSGSAFTLDTNAIHVNAMVLRSMQMTFDVGKETQYIETDSSTSDRRFANLTGNIQLTPRTRMLLLASVQESNSQSSDPAVALLGPQKDNRIGSDFIWRGGRQLTVSVRVQYVSGQELTGWTQRYHVDWYPFGDGTLQIGGSYDQDIDPTFDRKATRIIFNPRWIVNRWATIDAYYTSVDVNLQSTVTRQHSLYATLTLTK